MRSTRNIRLGVKEKAGKASPPGSLSSDTDSNTQNIPHSIFQGDCLDIPGRQVPPESVDLVFTSPPYAVGKHAGNGLRDAKSETAEKVVRFMKAQNLADLADKEDRINRENLVSFLS